MVTVCGNVELSLSLSFLMESHLLEATRVVFRLCLLALKSKFWVMI